MEELGISFRSGLGEAVSEPPIYRRIADSIAARIARGELEPGDRLPNHRDLATEFKVNVTTITRAFHTLKRRGLVETRPGRGTVILDFRNGAGRFQSNPSDERGVIDLSVNRPATAGYLDALADLLPRLARDRRYLALKDYQPAEGPLWLREAAALWLKKFIPTAEASSLFVGAGAQHTLACILASVTRPGDVVIADEITYMGLVALCRARGLILRGLAMDEHGMRPDAFDEACLRWQPRLVFVMPSLHNPTAITMPEARRRALAAIARRHNVLILEDDVYAPLMEEHAPAFATLEPELTVHITCLSKSVAPGLRIGFALTPRALAADVVSALRVDCWNICPLSALTATMLLEAGAVDRIVESQKQELFERQALTSAMLAGYDLRNHPQAPHAWLTLPESWRAGDFTQACTERGVVVMRADPFSIGKDEPPNAVRINIAAARNRDDLRAALGVMLELLGTGPV
jgi:DNA-binding transcriptional MocR family regulator